MPALAVAMLLVRYSTDLDAIEHLWAELENQLALERKSYLFFRPQVDDTLCSLL